LTTEKEKTLRRKLYWRIFGLLSAINLLLFVSLSYIEESSKIVVLSLGDASFFEQAEDSGIAESGLVYLQLHGDSVGSLTTEKEKTLRRKLYWRIFGLLSAMAEDSGIAESGLVYLGKLEPASKRC
jgi:hypothetical protein